MNTEARRKASAVFHAKRTAEGWKKVTMWMHPDTVEELTRLAKVYGSKEAAASMCINHHSDERRQKEARKPVKVEPKPAFQSRLKGEWKAP